MSGPKSSSYTLTEARRRELERQREAELRRIEEEKRKAEELRQKNMIISDVSDIVKVISEKVSEIGAQAEEETEIWSYNKDDGGWKLCYEDAKKEESKARFISASLHTAQSISKLKDSKKQVEACNASVDVISKRLDDINRQNRKIYEDTIKHHIDSAFQEDMSFRKSKKEADKIVEKIFEDNMKRLAILKSKELPLGLMEKIYEAEELMGVLSIETIKTFQALHIIPLERECNSFLKEKENYENEIFELLPTYLSLCERMEEKPKSFTATRVSIDILKKEIERLKDEFAADDEEAYISSSIDEAMKEMGYRVLGSQDIRKKNGKSIHKELYRYGDGTAVNVSYSSDGKITMELGALDTKDRAPSLTEAESLCLEMESFCEDFSEIEKILERKGVILKDRISHLPPDASYAQVINVTDYELTEGYEEHEEAISLGSRADKHLYAEED